VKGTRKIGGKELAGVWVEIVSWQKIKNGEKIGLLVSKVNIPAQTSNNFETQQGTFYHRMSVKSAHTIEIPK